MSIKDKLQAARSVIDAHNATIEEAESRVNADAFFIKLKAAGGTSDSTLQEARWEDLEECGLPRILARSISRIFRARASDEDGDGTQKVVVIDDDPVKRAARLKPVDLVAEYDMDDPHNPYGTRLGEIAGGRPFLVFNEDGSLNVGVSRPLFQELLDDYPVRTSVTVEGTVCKTFQVGDKPSRFVDENPLFKHSPLRPDGASVYGVLWGEVEFKIRQVVSIAARETREINTTVAVQSVSATSADRDKQKRQIEQELFDIISSKDFLQVCNRYPEAAVRFEELKKMNQLPQLKVRLDARGTCLSEEQGQDPFSAGNIVT